MLTLYKDNKEGVAFIGDAILSTAKYNLPTMEPLGGNGGLVCVKLEDLQCIEIGDTEEMDETKAGKLVLPTWRTPGDPQRFLEKMSKSFEGRRYGVYRDLVWVESTPKEAEGVSQVIGTAAGVENQMYRRAFWANKGEIEQLCQEILRIANKEKWPVEKIRRVPFFLWGSGATYEAMREVAYGVKEKNPIWERVKQGEIRQSMLQFAHTLDQPEVPTNQT